MLNPNEKESPITDLNEYLKSTCRGTFNLMKLPSIMDDHYFDDSIMEFCDKCISVDHYRVFNNKRTKIQGGKKRRLDRDYTVGHIAYIPCTHDPEDGKYIMNY